MKEDRRKAYDIPILFIIFNRLDTTRLVFEEIKKQRPKYLYIAADGPRENVESDIENCQKTREIIKEIDWDCQLKTLFRNENLGCGKAVSSAITWFFEDVEMGLIIEDDCLPHSDFFGYCKELLIRYKDENQIKIITGDNFQKGNNKGDISYYFSPYTHIWGWASWRRVWQEYDFELDSIEIKDFKNSLKHYKFSWSEKEFWLDKFVSMKRKQIDTWDYQLCFSIWRERGLNIIPNSNLISNIGFGGGATHTKDVDNPMADIPSEAILPLIHPEKIERNRIADQYTYCNYYKKSVLSIILRKLRRTFT